MASPRQENCRTTPSRDTSHHVGSVSGKMPRTSNPTRRYHSIVPATSVVFNIAEQNSCAMVPRIRLDGRRGSARPRRHPGPRARLGEGVAHCNDPGYQTVAEEFGRPRSNFLAEELAAGQRRQLAERPAIKERKKEK
jgi:hypothetical protein